MPSLGLVALAVAVAQASAERSLRHDGVARATAAVSAVGGALVVGLGPSAAWLSGGAAGPGPALAAVITVAAIALAAQVASSPADREAGLGLAGLAGLSAILPPLASVLQPLALVLGLRSLRRGARWPLFGPMLFVAGAAVAVALLAPAASVGPGQAWLDALGGHAVRAWRMAATTRPEFEASGLVALPDRLGVVGVLLAALGVGRLVLRAPARALVTVVVLATLTLAAAAAAAPGTATSLATVAAGGASTARVVVVLALGPAVAAGIAQVAATFGRAEVPAACAVATMALVEPVLVVWPGLGP